MDRHHIASFTGRFAALGPVDDVPQRLVVLSVMWALCYWLHRRRIFLRI